MIRNIKDEDAPQVASIYNYYINNSIITFDETPVHETNIREKAAKIQSMGYPFIVYEEDGNIIGYAYVDNWRHHAAYRITLETSIYLAPDKTRKGAGSLLYRKLIEQVRKLSIHSLIGVLSLPNNESQALHKKFGFLPVGTFKEVGFKSGKLIDVEFWQLIL